MISEPVILHLETSGKNCSVAISKGDLLLCLCEEMSDDFSHSKKLHTFVEWALEGAELNLQNLDAVSVSKGPGSYTGLRIGVSAAKGFALGLEIPLLSTQSLRTLAYPFFEGKNKKILSTLKARKNEIYYQILPSLTTESEPFNTIINNEFLSSFYNENWTIIGSGAPLIKNYLEAENNHTALNNFECIETSKISAQYAIQEALIRFKKQKFENLAYFEPQYVKSVHITPKKKS